jgi:predicted metal-dependent peptidase
MISKCAGIIPSNKAEADKLITKANGGLVLSKCFWGQLVLRPEYVLDTNCKTAWTDGKQIGFNPDFILSHPIGQVKTITAHEGGHDALGHCFRRGDRLHEDWNVACDHVINLALKEDGFEPIPGWFCDDRYKGMSAEQVYTLIHPAREKARQEKREQEKQDGQLGGGKGPDGNSGPGNPQDGNDPGGNGQGNNPNGNDPGKCGEVRDYPGKDGKPATDGEIAEGEGEWKVAVVQAAQQAKAMGKVSAGLARIIGNIVEPKQDWRIVLRRFADQLAKDNITWTTPSRRYIGNGFYMPSRKSERIPPWALIVDTSGSIDEQVLSEFNAEVNDMLYQYEMECMVIYADSKVCKVETITSSDMPVILRPEGGGGTDFRPAFEYIESNDVNPAFAIYFTDMECSRFPEEPEYPVLWVKWGQYGQKAPFGEEIEI